MNATDDLDLGDMEMSGDAFNNMEEQASPKRKRREKRTKKDKAKETAINTTLVLKPGKFSPTVATGTTKPCTRITPPLAPPHVYKYVRQVIDALCMLLDEDKHANISRNLNKLMENGLKVEETFVINPVVEGNGDD